MTDVLEAGGLESPADSPRQALRFPALDGLRGLAALAVVTTHVGFQTGRTNRPGFVGYLLARGDFGVTAFFLLSGFLLYRPLLLGVRGPALRTYLRRRALRILPVYWLAVIVALRLMPQNAGTSLNEWVRQLTLTQVYGGHLVSGLTQMWSLCTEVAFYAALPLFALLVSWFRRRAAEEVGGRVDVLALVTLIVIGVVFTAAAASSRHLPATAHLWLPAYADWFALGMGTAVLHRRLTRGTPNRWTRLVTDLSQAPGTCLAVGVLLFLLACTRLGGPKLLDPPTSWEATAKHVLYGLSAAMLLLPSVFAPTAGSVWTRLLASRPLHWVGQVSYSIFALHLVVLHFVLKGLGYPEFTGHFATVWLVTAGASIAIASVSHVLVERPALRWRSGSRTRVSATGPLPRPSSQGGRERHEDEQLRNG